MNMNEPQRFDTARLRGTLTEREPMGRHVSWRAGGPAARAYRPADLADLREFLAALPAGEPVLLVGLGSNLLVRDGGFAGTVIFTHGVLNRVQLETAANGPALVYAEAGVPGPKVARYAALNDLTGAEFLAGIPGTVGGALAMNAGCYGGETWRIVERATTIDRSGQLHIRRPEEYDIDYRFVRLKSGGDEWFVAAHFRLTPGEGARSREAIRELLGRRIASQPLNQPNAGSVFRNPPGDYAARLIEACGLKGARAGGAEISRKHANFIVNAGGARAADIEALVLRAEQAVRERFGIALEREVRILGEDA